MLDACPEERAYVIQPHHSLTRAEEERRKAGVDEKGRKREKTSEDPGETGPPRYSPDQSTRAEELRGKRRNQSHSERDVATPGTMITQNHMKSWLQDAPFSKGEIERAKDKEQRTRSQKRTQKAE
ncbi:hypothetical protein NDU88_011452 [Pleurodeles waltl]|uniref:Uncharacterized protein n=1 Tax=Pleurodeles waltl TaxID=8319 RepID=A0AAV7QXA3_PLEWA|nr:hypothetical protein NDU88_011452 [Pleurodeles waltl]